MDEDKLKYLEQYNIYDLELKIINQIIETLIYLQKQKIVHTAIRPQNIIIQDNYKILIKNFGYSKIITSNQGYQILQQKCQKNIYMAPQCYEDKVHIKTDYFSLGIIISQFFKKQIEDSKRNHKYIKEIQYLSKLVKKITKIKAELRQDIKQLQQTKIQSKIVSPNQKNKSNKQIIINIETSPNLDTKVEQFRSYTNLKQFRKSRQNENLRQLTTSAHISRTRQINKNQKKNNESKDGLQNINGLKMKYGKSQQVAYGIAKKRNFSVLLLKLSNSCMHCPQVKMINSMPLVFMLAKKSTYVISQVAKFIKFGKNNQMILSQKVKDAFQKSQFYSQLNSTIDKQMQSSQNKFRILVNYLKQTQLFKSNDSFCKQLSEETVDNGYLKKCIISFFNQLSFLSSDNPEQDDIKQKLISYYLLSLVNQYQSLQQMYDDLFTGGTLCLVRQPFYNKIKKLSNQSILRLIRKNHTAMNDIIDNKSQNSNKKSNSNVKLLRSCTMKQFV